MTILKFYGYAKCSTCQNAIKYLKKNQIDFNHLDIITSPPSESELSQMLNFLKEKNLTIKNLFNVSGEVYRELNMKEKINNMTEKELIHLLSTNGKLIKRPFLLSHQNGLVGFKENEWDQFFT
jgi:arsenate reductase